MPAGDDAMRDRWTMDVGVRRDMAGAEAVPAEATPHSRRGMNRVKAAAMEATGVKTSTAAVKTATTGTEATTATVEAATAASMESAATTVKASASATAVTATTTAAGRVGPIGR